MSARTKPRGLAGVVLERQKEGGKHLMKFRAEFDDRGFKELRKRLQRLKDFQKVPLGELFSVSFMARHTRYPSIDAFMEAAGADSEEKVRAIFDDPNADTDFNRFVAANSSFSSFSEMLEAAAAEYVRKQLGL